MGLDARGGGMIVDPYRQKDRLRTFAGTNILREDFGLIGRYFFDPHEADRPWRIEAFYQPEAMSRTGVRAKVRDGHDFVSFVLQHDLEVLLEMYKPGQKCPWSGRSYGDPEDHDFYGVQADSDDLADDLYDRELVLRGCYENVCRGGLPQNAEIQRRVHLGRGEDWEELLVLVRDDDPDTGARPDIAHRRVEGRWKRAERTRLNRKML